MKERNRDCMVRRGLLGSQAKGYGGRVGLVHDSEQAVYSHREVGLGATGRQVKAGPSFESSAKRAFDLVLATGLLVVTLPFFVVIAVAIVIDSPGGTFYRCIRVGRRGRMISMIKFRKMRHDARGVALTVSGDRRFTRVGRFLAHTKLDELPQLWNVVRGDMSLVGPRPEDPGFVERCGEAYTEILTVRPGITGLCQLAFAKEGEIIDPDNPVEDYVSRLLPQKVALDRLYARQQTFGMDLRILGWTTLAVILRRSVAVNRATGALSFRCRPNGDGSIQWMEAS